MLNKSVMVLMTPDTKSIEKLRSFLLDKGLAVFVAGEMTNAVRLMKTKAVDLLICDTHCLESGNHDELRAQLEMNNIRGELPMILVSADIGPNAKTWFKKFTGVKALVQHPLDLNQVYRLVKANLEAEGSRAFDLTDNDEDKPFVDPADRKSIEITSRISRVKEGSTEPPMQASLIELRDESVLLEVHGQGFAPKDLVEVKIVTSGTQADGEILFKGQVLSMEETDTPGIVIVTVDSKAAADAISTKLRQEIKKRQDDLAEFMRLSRG